MARYSVSSQTCSASPGGNVVSQPEWLNTAALFFTNSLSVILPTWAKSLISKLCATGRDSAESHLEEAGPGLLGIVQTKVGK